MLKHSVERRAFRGTTYGFLQFGLTFVQSILLVPLLLTRWGQEKYGIYIAVFAFLQLLRTLDLGHQSYIGNEYNKEYHVNKEKATIILISSIRMALLLGGIELFVFIFFWISGTVYNVLGIAPSHSYLMIGLLCMVLMWWLVGSVAGVMSRAVLSKGLYPETLLWAIGLKVLEIIFLIIAGIVNMSLLKVLLFWSVINLVYMGLATKWTMRHLIDFNSLILIGTWKRAIAGFRKSIVLTFNNGFEQLNTNGIIFLITKFISISLLPVFVTLRTITNTTVQFTGLFISPLQPELIRYNSEKSGEKIYSVIQAIWIISGIFINITLIAIIPVIEWLYSLWTKNILPFNKPLFFLLCISVALANLGKVLIAYLTGINDLKAITLVSGSKCIIIFGVSLIFIHKYGLISIGIGFLIAELISSVLIPIYLTKRKLKTMNANIQVVDIILALLPVGILSLSYLLNLLNIFNPWIVSICGISIMLIIIVMQWNRLHYEVQLRIKTLFGHLIKRGQKLVALNRNDY